MYRGDVNGYELMEEIGEGEFGKVILAKNKGGMYFAIKVIPVPNIEKNMSIQSFLAKETSILLKLNHPNIIEFVEEFQRQGHLFIVYEYCNKGNLRKYARLQGGLDEPQAVYVFREVLKALIELERLGIVHRDIKPDNILLKDTKVKLADFGLSCEAYARHKRLIGSPVYMSPEAMREYTYTIKGDIYALGVTLYKSLTTNFPFYHDQYEILLDLKEKFTYEQMPMDLSNSVRHLLWGCLNPDPNQRLGTSDMLNFIQQYYPGLDGGVLENDSRRRAPLKPLPEYRPNTPQNTHNPLHKKFGNSSPLIHNKKLANNSNFYDLSELFQNFDPNNRSTGLENNFVGSSGNDLTVRRMSNPLQQHAQFGPQSVYDRNSYPQGPENQDSYQYADPFSRNYTMESPGFDFRRQSPPINPLAASPAFSTPRQINQQQPLYSNQFYPYSFN